VPSRSGTPAPVALDPAVIAELKATFAEFVGPLAKALVDRAVVRTGNVSDLLDLLASELDSPDERERFLRAVPAALRET
jgi:hypothetical protein